jgi:hypothetical protein
MFLTNISFITLFLCWNFCNIMKIKNIPHVRNSSKIHWKNHRGQIDINTLPHKYMIVHLLDLAQAPQRKGDGVRLLLWAQTSPRSEVMWSCKWVPHKENNNHNTYQTSCFIVIEISTPAMWRPLLTYIKKKSYI